MAKTRRARNSALLSFQTANLHSANSRAALKPTKLGRKMLDETFPEYARKVQISTVTPGGFGDRTPEFKKAERNADRAYDALFKNYVEIAWRPIKTWAHLVDLAIATHCLDYHHISEEDSATQNKALRELCRVVLKLACIQEAACNADDTRFHTPEYHAVVAQNRAHDRASKKLAANAVKKAA